MSKLDKDWMTLPDGSKVPRPKRVITLTEPDSSQPLNQQELKEEAHRIASGIANYYAENSADPDNELTIGAGEQAIVKLHQASLTAFADGVSKEVVGKIEKAIKQWSDHAYSLEASAIDQVVYEGKGDSETKSRRDDNVTDRRALILASHIAEKQKAALAQLRKDAGI